jgi:hypothetical protein
LSVTGAGISLAEESENRSTNNNMSEDKEKNINLCIEGS